MSRLAFLSLLLACRAEVEPVATPEFLPECNDWVWREQVWDCNAIDPCAPDLEHRLACCDCDPYYCEQTLECVPPEFPPDVGPVLTFDRAVLGVLAATGGAPDELLITPDLVVTSDSPTRGTQAVCVRANNTFTCEPLVVALEWGALRFEVFDLIVTDADGDGVADGGMLRVDGRYSAPMQESPFSTVLPVSSDVAGEPVAMPVDVLPTRPVMLKLEELGLDGPIPTLVVGDEVRALEAVPGVGGVVAYRAVDGQPVLPWGAELSLDGALADVSGNPVGFLAGAVVANPGPWTANPGFEGTGGWARMAFELPYPYPVREGFDLDRTDPDAWDGARVAYTESGGLLLGQAVIPADVSTLAFALRSEGYSAPIGVLTVVTPSNERTVIWEFDPSQLVGCEGGGSSQCLPWTLQTADVSPWAGQSVYFELEVQPAPFPDALTSPSPTLIRVAVDGFAFE